MSASLPEERDTVVDASHNTPQEQMSDVDGDGDGSSSLSEIEDKDGEQDEDEDLSNVSEENDSEAETERLEDSPQKARKHQDVVLTGTTSRVYDQSPSKLKHTTTVDEDDDEDDPLSDIEDEEDNMSANQSGSSDHEAHERKQASTVATTLEDSSSEGKTSLNSTEVDSKKRKRSIMAGSGLDLEEPLRKRTGSVMTPGDEYAVDDDENREEGEITNPTSADNSIHDGAEAQDEVDENAGGEEGEIQAPVELPPSPKSPKKRGRKKKKITENGAHLHGQDTEMPADGDAMPNGDENKNGDDENVDHELDDEAEAALRNEEELEKKRSAQDQLSLIERQFSTFRERLFEERLEQLNKEEAMLKQDVPTHPEYLAMMQCIDARRDERLRISENLRSYELQTLKNYAVARRSQILTQYQQEVREIRERKLEEIGKQWYEIQHDRRIYAGSVPDYTYKFPTKRNQQVSNQIAYNNEVSILSGIAKYVGFPAAPPMAATTDAELADDLEKMGRSRQPVPIHRQNYPLPDVGLRTAGSSLGLRPAEEQFIEQTPWANPQHPSHAHLLQRQTSAQQTPRTISPFAHSQAQPRRHSHQHGTGAPPSGTFSSSSTAQNLPGVSLPGNGASLHNPFTNSHTHVIAPSPLASRQPSLSPQQSHHGPPVSLEQPIRQPTLMDIAAASTTIASPQLPRAGEFGSDPTREFSRDDLKREQIAAMMTRF
ncbi:transcriptional regulatory protein dep1-like protein [Phlyctema vagabunda]|uniref:Transcriptional regulatory protein dep1-like protein n=1 Tax=Phlyctema vagabunda TaxID=108571 RepID=A0ABR4P3B8_9HELO